MCHVNVGISKLVMTLLGDVDVAKNSLRLFVFFVLFLCSSFPLRKKIVVICFIYLVAGLK